MADRHACMVIGDLVQLAEEQTAIMESLSSLLHFHFLLSKSYISLNGGLIRLCSSRGLSGLTTYNLSISDSLFVVRAVYILGALSEICSPLCD